MPGRGWLVARAGLALAGLALAGCAAEDHLPLQPGRVPRPDAVGLPLDLGADADAEPADATLPDAAPADSGPLPATGTWPRMAILWPDDPRAGLRSALQPPQVPVPDADPFATAPEGLWVVWSGPDSPGDAQLTALADRGPVAPFWDLGSRPDDAQVLAAVAADARWLAARHLARDRLHLAERPLLAVRGWQRWPERWTAARAALAGLPVSPAWVLEVDPEAAPSLPAEAVGLFSSRGAGVPPTGDIEPNPESIEALERWQLAAATAGVAWFARARPGRNPRLDAPGAPVESPELSHWKRALLLARRAVSAGPRPTGGVLLDGFGAWRDDHQLDATVGAGTAEPRPLTDGRTWPAGGDERRVLAQTLLSPPTDGPPSTVPTPSPLLVQVAPGLRLDLRVDPAEIPWILQVLVARVPDAEAPLWAEISLWSAGARLGPSTRLQAWRDSDRLCLDAIFTDGTRWLDLHPEACPGAVGDFELILEPAPGVGLAELAVRLLPGLEGAARLGDLRLR